MSKFDSPIFQIERHVTGFCQRQLVFTQCCQLKNCVLSKSRDVCL